MYAPGRRGRFATKVAKSNDNAHAEGVLHGIVSSKLKFINEEDNGVREAFFLCPVVLFFIPTAFPCKSVMIVSITDRWTSKCGGDHKPPYIFLGGENYEYYIGS